VSRFFAPADGIPEDPVTGSAHTRSRRSGRSVSVATTSPACRRGRGGLVRTSIHGDRVHLTGRAVIVFAHAHRFASANAEHPTHLRDVLDGEV
jgi:predicted PhzF superfamily epimerase YddE/YHI9